MPDTFGSLRTEALTPKASRTRQALVRADWKFLRLGGKRVRPLAGRPEEA